MLVQFQPQSLDKVSPTVRAAEAVNLIAGFDRCADGQLYANEKTGEIAIAPPPAEHLTRWRAASEVLFEGVRSAAVQSFIWSFEQSAYLSIPRFHWNHLAPLDLYNGFVGAADIRGGDGSLDGQEVVLSLTELERWLPRARAEVDARFIYEPLAANDRAVHEREPLPVVKLVDLQAWVRERIAAGDTMETVGKTFRDAFPGKRQKQSRERVREIYREEFQATKGEVRPGPRGKN